jgi:hypothetical protein
MSLYCTRVAGENAAGGNAKFRGIASAITKVFDLFVGKTGLTKEDALRIACWRFYAKFRD